MGIFMWGGDWDMRTDYRALLSNQDPTPLLEKWRGGNAKFWSYTTSHRVLVVRVNFEQKQEYLWIFCGDVQYVRGPTSWENACLMIERISEDELILWDRQAGFEVRTAVIGVKETQEYSMP